MSGAAFRPNAGYRHTGTVTFGTLMVQLTISRAIGLSYLSKCRCQWRVSGRPAKGLAMDRLMRGCMLCPGDDDLLSEAFTTIEGNWGTGERAVLTAVRPRSSMLFRGHFHP